MTVRNPSSFNSIECAAQAAIYAQSATTNFENDGLMGPGPVSSFCRKSLMQFPFTGVTRLFRAWLEFTVLDFNNCLGINEGIGKSIRVERLRRTDINYSQVTWNIYKTGSNWGTAGAENTSTDKTITSVGYGIPFNDSASSGQWTANRVAVLTGATVQREAIDITVTMQEALDLGLSNLDISVFAAYTGGQNSFTTASRTNSTVAYRPRVIWIG